MLKPCIECGALSEAARCADHTRKSARRDTRTAHRVDTTKGAFRALSRRIRKAQPFCTACGETSNLQADHSPRAWARIEAKKPLRPCDLTVLCAQCNTRAGSSKPGSPRYAAWLAADGDLNSTTFDVSVDPWGVGASASEAPHDGQAIFGTHTPGGMR